MRKPRTLTANDLSQLSIPDPPVGRYGRGKLDLLAWVDGRIWACLLDNAAFCPQEFYCWDPVGKGWLDRTLPRPDSDPGPRVPYKTLLRLAGLADK